MIIQFFVSTALFFPLPNIFQEHCVSNHLPAFYNSLFNASIKSASNFCSLDTFCGKRILLLKVYGMSFEKYLGEGKIELQL